MSRVRSFFLREAAECLADIRAEVDGAAMDAAAVYAAVRRFRGSAQMARFDGLAREAGALEQRLRPYGSAAGGGSVDTEIRGDPGPAAEDALRRDVRDALDSLYADVEAVREGRMKEDPRMEAGMEDQEAEEGMVVVPIDTLEYRGEAALTRALELRTALEDAIVADEPAGPLLDELFDLIRLGAK